MYEVERVDPRGEDPSVKLKTQIEFGANEHGWQLVNVIPLFNEILLVWDKGGAQPGGIERRTEQ